MTTERSEMVDKEIALSSAGRYVCPAGHEQSFEFWNCGRAPYNSLADYKGECVMEGRVFCKPCSKLYGVGQISVPD